MNRGLLLFALALVISGPPRTSHAAPELDQCPAKRYKPCSAFSTNVEIGKQEPLIDNHLAGFTRSKGTWKINVHYQPEAECAKVNILLNMGPIDTIRQYKGTFRNGGGVISDSGTFMHKIDDLESALRIPHSSCYVPDSEASKMDAQAENRRRSEELERLALEEERELLALEREREQRELEMEGERLALERERLALEQELKTAQERRRFERERKRQRRLAEQRERERERWLAEQNRERERIAQRQNVQEDTRTSAEGSALNTIITGLALGVGVGAAITDDEAAFDAASNLLSTMGNTYVLPSNDRSSASGGGTRCKQIGERLRRDLERLSGSNSMCTIYRGTAQAYRQARNDLAATGCATSQELTDLDQAIRQAGAGARTSCGGG